MKAVKVIAGLAVVAAIVLILTNQHAGGDPEGPPPPAKSASVSEPAHEPAVPASSGMGDSLPPEEPEIPVASGIEDSVPPEEADRTQLPEITVGDDAFRQAFAANPVDAAYAENARNAASLSKLALVTADARDAWKKITDAAFTAAHDSAPDKQKEEIQRQQTDWMNRETEEVRNLRAANAGDSIKAEKEVLAYYRGRAAELYLLAYENTGGLPDFTQAWP